MYPVSLAFKNAIQQPSRDFVAKVIIDEVEYNNDYVIEIVLDELINPNDDFAIGSTPASKLELTLIDVGNIPAGSVVEPFIGLDTGGIIEYVPLGVFIVDSSEKAKKITKLTCLDQMILLDIPFDITPLIPQYPSISIRDIALEACLQAGVTLATTIPDTQISPAKWTGYTCREIIGFVASFLGGNARMNRQGELEIVFFGGSETAIDTENIFDLNTGDSPVTIEKISCIVTDNNTLTVGTGRNVTLENPAMTQTQLTQIYTYLSTISYMPFEMQWQGNPALQAGDAIAIIDANGTVHHSYIMEQQLRFRGGLTGTANAKGLTDTAADYKPSKGPLRRQIDRQVSEAMEGIEGEIDGIFTAINDANSAIDGIYTSVNTINGTIDSINTIIDGKLDAIDFGIYVDEAAGLIASKVAASEFESYWIQTADTIASVLQYESFESYMTQTAAMIANKVSNDEFESYWIQEADKIAATLEHDSFQSYMTQTAQEVASKVSNNDFDSYIQQTAQEIALLVRGDGVIAAINVSTEAIKIQSSKIDLIGAVTVLSDITGDLGTITAGTMIGTTFMSSSSTSRVEFNALGLEGYESNALVQRITYSGYTLYYGNGNAASNFSNQSWLMNYLDGSTLFRLNTVNGLYVNADAVFQQDVEIYGNVTIHGGIIGDDGYVHPTGFSDKPTVALTGAAVISQVLVNDEGHLTGVNTRNLTPADIGAAPAAHGTHLPSGGYYGQVLVNNGSGGSWYTLQSSDIGAADAYHGHTEYALEINMHYHSNYSILEQLSTSMVSDLATAYNHAITSDHNPHGLTLSDLGGVPSITFYNFVDTVNTAYDGLDSRISLLEDAVFG